MEEGVVTSEKENTFAGFHESNGATVVLFSDSGAIIFKSLDRIDRINRIFLFFTVS